jgi:superfamily I DNA/RNA helicase
MDKQIIFGAPGCGKTTKLMEILNNELEKNDPDRIAFVSFTRKGAYEGRDRAMEKFNLTENDFPYFRTLHSIAFRQGGFSKYDMISKKDYKMFSDSMGMKFTGYYTEDFRNNDDKYLFLNFLERNNLAMASVYKSIIDIKTYRSVKYNYKEFKKFSSIYDFTDILQFFVDNNTALPVDVAIIDEAQDLTTLQWDMCAIAFRDCKRIYIAGDDDQAIYEWNGADVGRFLDQKGDRLILDKSYRLQKKILDFSKKITEKINNRVDKKFEPMSDEGDIFFYNDIEEIKINPTETYYFLARNNWFLQIHKALLMKKAKTFMYKHDHSIKQKDIDNIHLFEKVRKNKKATDQEQTRLMTFCKENFNIERPWYENFKLDNDTLVYYRDLIRLKTPIDTSKIMVNTIHGVKGGEADNVILLTDFTRAVRNSFEMNPDAELRCLYVACTRAKKHLHIVHSQTKNGYDEYINMRL